MLDPRTVNDLKDKVLPKQDDANTLKDPEVANDEYTLTPLPAREKLREERELANLTSPKTDKELPKEQKPNTLAELPILEKH